MSWCACCPAQPGSRQESRAYLERSGVPAEQFAQVLAFTHGHPLALSLVADLFAQRRDFEFQPEAEPDIIRALLERLVQKVPGPAHRAALEVCALVRQTTEAQLCEMLGMADVHELFEWLRGLSFIESERRGLLPHSLAREALATDLRWRNPDWYAELHRRARAYYANQLQQTHDQEQQQSILLDYIYLHRNSPILRLSDLRRMGWQRVRAARRRATSRRRAAAAGDGGAARGREPRRARRALVRTAATRGHRAARSAGGAGRIPGGRGAA